jgi:uncharacterized protein YoxC
MQITFTIGQLLLLITCGVFIIICIYILQTLKNLRDTVTDGTRLITRNEEQISLIIMHVEQISANAHEISRILCGKGSFPLEKADLPPQGLLHGLQDLHHAFREISGSATRFRKTIKKLGR